MALIGTCGTHDSLLWVDAIRKLTGRVCRVDIGSGRAVGTGFLVGVDLVLTCFHVLAAAIGNGRTARDVRFVFDHLQTRTRVRAGVRYGLRRRDWLVAASPDGPLDDRNLDFAIVQLAGAPGRKRGWIELPVVASDEGGGVVHVLQHPFGQPQKLSTGVVIPGDARTVRYTATTHPASSGAPVFLSDLTPVALHKSCERITANDQPIRFNYGVRLALIGAAAGAAAPPSRGATSATARRSGRR